MKKKPLDLRTKDDPKIWAKLPRKADDAFNYLYQKLVEDNDVLGAFAEKKGCDPFEEAVRKKVSPSQEVLLLIYRMDSQILNGGLTQFVWNAPCEFEDAEKAIKKLEQSEFAKLYKKAVEHADAK